MLFYQDKYKPSSSLSANGQLGAPAYTCDSFASKSACSNFALKDVGLLFSIRKRAFLRVNCQSFHRRKAAPRYLCPSVRVSIRTYVWMSVCSICSVSSPSPFLFITRMFLDASLSSLTPSPFLKHQKKF